MATYHHKLILNMYNIVFSVINLFHVLFDCANDKAIQILNGKEHKGKELIQPHTSLLLNSKNTEYLLSKLTGCKNKVGFYNPTI